MWHNAVLINFYGSEISHTFPGGKHLLVAGNSNTKSILDRLCSRLKMKGCVTWNIHSTYNHTAKRDVKAFTIPSFSKPLLVRKNVSQRPAFVQDNPFHIYRCIKINYPLQVFPKSSHMKIAFWVTDWNIIHDLYKLISTHIAHSSLWRCNNVVTTLF